jgi:hypothetical protein
MGYDVPYKTVDTQVHFGSRTDKPAPELTEVQLKELERARSRKASGDTH